MKHILLFIACAWVLWLPAILLSLFPKDSAVARNGNLVLAAYASLILTGWLFLQGTLIATIAFFIAACCVFANWPSQERRAK